MIADRINIKISGQVNGPPLILHHALGVNLEMWQPQLSALEPHFRVIRMDMRGHGKSLPTDAPYSLEDLADDVITVLDHLNIEKADYLGISIGGMIGSALALQHPTRINRLILSNTTSQIMKEMHPMWDARIQSVREGGMDTQIDITLMRWFTPEYQSKNPETLKWVAAMVCETSPEGFIGCCEAIKGLDFLKRLPEIDTPCLVITGAKDLGTPPEKSYDIQAAIKGAQLEIIDEVAHLSNVQAPEKFNTLITSFLIKGDHP